MTFPSIAYWFVQSPWMLLALLSLLVPLIIHLFSKSKGKLVPFGNIRLIQLSKPVKMNEIRLVERLLLCCRLLMLFFSVLLLAQLYYDERSNTDGATEGNILITNDWLNNATEAELKTLALKAENVPTYLLSARVERLTSDKIVTWKNTVTNTNKSNYLKESKQQNTWLLVNNYAKTLPNNVNIKVYTTNRLSQFINGKIYFPDNITWNIKHLSEDEITNSMESLINKTLSVVVISDKSNSEYLPALKAVLSIIQTTKLENLAFSFHLSDELNDELFQDEQAKDDLPKGNSLEYEPSKSDQLHNNITGKYDSILYLSSAPIPLFINQEVRKGTSLIADITHAKDPTVTHLVNWDELVTKITFPSELMSLLLDEAIKDHRMQQQLSDEQITSQLVHESSAIASSLGDKDDYKEQTNKEHYASKYTESFKNESMTQLLIILLVLFWSLERLLSEKFRKVQEESTLTKAFNSDNVSHSSDMLVAQTLRGKDNV